jgi:hypothetical protein
MLLDASINNSVYLRYILFQRAPTLGGECYECYIVDALSILPTCMFQRAPTLGGECYTKSHGRTRRKRSRRKFQRAPTLGGECYDPKKRVVYINGKRYHTSFNGHPPLGVNATQRSQRCRRVQLLQMRFNGHPPLGVNATRTNALSTRLVASGSVSTGTHPWG